MHLQDCVTGTYHAHPKCEKFFVCVNGMLIGQNCAPGLVWRQDRTQCDFPSAYSCTDRRQGVSAPLIDASGVEMIDDHEQPSKYTLEIRLTITFNIFGHLALLE